MHSATLLVRLLLFVTLATRVLVAADTPPPSAVDLHALLLQAITERRVVVFNYDGRRRVVEPHAYGDSRRGRGLLRGYETDASETDPATRPPGWALFSVSKMGDVELSDRTFAEPRAGYRRGDRKMLRIHAEL